MKRSALALLGIFSLSLLSACLHQTIIGSNGERNEIIKCFAYIGIEDCYNHARQVCGGNYKIISSTLEDGLVTGRMHSLLVKCERNPSGS